MFSPAINVSLFQSQLVDSEKGYKPLFKALNTVAEESIYEIWSKVTMADSKRVLANVMEVIFAHQTLMISMLVDLNRNIYIPL